MAISSLVVGGNAGARPPVGAFFGKTSAANDNAQKVSSDFISKDILGSVLGNISGISAELKKIQQFSKDAIKAFERLVVDMRKMNNDITSKFKSVNSQMKKDNVDFLRAITKTYGDALETVNVPEAAGKAAGAAGVAGAAAAGGSSILDTAASVASTAADLLSGSKKAVGAAAAKEGVKDIAKAGAKPTLKAVVKKVAMSAGGKMLAKAIPGVALVAGLFSAASRAFEGDLKGAAAEATLGAAATIPGVGTAASVAGNVALLARDIYKEYYGVQPEDDPQAKERLQEIVDMLKSEISGDVKDDKADNGLSSVPPEVLRSWQMNHPEMVKAYSDGTLTDDDKAKVAKLFAEGNNTAAERLIAMKTGIEAAPTEKKLADTGKNITSRNLAATIAGPEAANDAKQFAGVADKAAAGISAAVDETGGKPAGATPTTPETPAPAATAPAAEAAPAGAPMKVADIPESKPADTAPAEGGTPAPAEPTNANPPAAAPGAPMKAEEDFSNLANVAGVQVEKGKDLPPNALAALDAMVENDPQAAAKKYPAWVLEQYAKQIGKEGAPAPAASPQAMADTAGEGAASAPGGDSGTGAPAGESGAPSGAPEPVTPSPSAPEAPPPVPEKEANPEPIVMNNNSSSASGSVSGGEADNMSGQNLPMTAQNDALSEYFSKQNIDYQ
jgi:hypothetical protein